MKNVIKNQKLFFISLIGIIVVSSILIYTYAYQSLQVVYKSGSKEKLTINAGVLDVTFAVTNRLNIASMPLLSSYKSAEYSEFTISNTKSSDDAAYKVSITDMTYTSNLVSSDFNYTLVNADTNEIVSEDNFSDLTGTSIELTDFITLKKNNSVKLRLYLWLKETTSNQNSLENASFKGKIEITSMFDKEVPKNPFKKGTFAYTIINNALNVTNEQKELGYAVYRETPLTTPAVETTMKYNKIGEEATSGSSVSISTTYQGYYWTYGTGYTVDESTGKFTLTGVSTCKYNDGTCHETLVGKYIVSTNASSNSNSSNTQKTTTNLWNIYKVTTAPASSTSIITMKAKKINNTYYSVESTLSTTPDDYGDSYYFRGNVVDNFVQYAGMCWRIVRIQGDGSIKLILASELSCSDTNVTTSSGYATDGAAGVQGTRLTATYGYKLVGSYYIDDYINSAGTTENARTKLNAWLERKITSESEKALLKNEDWCIGDRTTAYDRSTHALKTETAEELINAGTAFDYSAAKRGLNTKTPTLKCDGKKDKDGEVDTNKVGMLTQDEVAFAGATSSSNLTYYLNKNAKFDFWWTLSPSSFGIDGSFVRSFGVSSDGGLSRGSVHGSLDLLRVAVTLSSSTMLNSGNGTVNNAYIVG